MAEEQDIASTRIRLTQRRYVKLGTLLSILVAIAGGMYTLVDREFKMRNELETLQKNYDSSQEQLQNVRRELSLKTKALTRLDRTVPIPDQPERDSIIIDPLDYNEVELQWIDPVQPEGAEYEIVLHSPSRSSIPKPKDVTPPAKNREKVHREGHGVFFWKIGDVTNKRWSDYASFSVYPSTLERVRATERLVVGRTRNYDQYDNGVVRLEDELVDLIAKYLERKFDILDVKVDRRKIDWRNLLEAVKSGDVDIALANITKSKRRERDYFPLKFSVGYLPNHQLLVHRKGERYPEFPDGLRGKVVGAHVGSINLKAAGAISKKYGFVVNDKAPSYAHSLRALEKGDIDFAMIDVVAYAERKTRLTRNIECYGPSGPEFDEILREFYMRELERPDEEIAIAVHDRHPDTAKITLLKLINEMLQSREGQSEIERLKKLHFSRPEDPCEG